MIFADKALITISQTYCNHLCIFTYVPKDITYDKTKLINSNLPNLLQPSLHLHYYAPKISYKAMKELLFFFLIPRPTLLKVNN